MIGEGFAGHEFQNEAQSAALLFEAINGGDVGMVERGEDLRFALESGEAVGGLGEIIGENFDGYFAGKASVFGAVDFAHSAGAEWRDDLIGAEFCAYK